MERINVENSSYLNVTGNKNNIQFENLKLTSYSNGDLHINGDDNIAKGNYISGDVIINGSNNNIQGGDVNFDVSMQGNSNDIQFGDITTSVNLNGDYNKVQIGDINESVYLEGDYNKTQFGNVLGSDLSVKGDNNFVKGGDVSRDVDISGKNLYIQVGNIQNTLNVTFTGGNNTVQFGNVNEGSIHADEGDKNTIIGGDGKLDISLHGSDQIIKLGNGEHNISNIIGNSKIITGDDDDKISFSGYGNIINAGNGNNWIESQSDEGGSARITTGNGNDEIRIKGSNNIIESGKGHDKVSGGLLGHNKYILDQAFTSISTYTEINNFDAKQGDVLDLKKSLANTTFGNTAKDFTSLKNYVSVTNEKGYVNIGISQYGDNHFTTLATLYNQNTPVTLDSLVTQGAISYS